MKLVNETLLEFKKGLDPIDSLGMGRYKLIEDWLQLMDIHSYYINNDYTIDVHGDVILDGKGLQEFPDYIQFNNIKGSFLIHYNRLRSLKGCPKKVGGSFLCLSNKLKTLDFGPEEVGINYWAHDNQLVSLKGCATKIGGSFSCNRNKLSSLKYSPSKLNDVFYCGNNPGKFTEKDVLAVCKATYIDTTS